MLESLKNNQAIQRKPLRKKWGRLFPNREDFGVIELECEKQYYSLVLGSQFIRIKNLDWAAGLGISIAHVNNMLLYGRHAVDRALKWVDSVGIDNTRLRKIRYRHNLLPVEEWRRESLAAIDLQRANLIDGDVLTSVGLYCKLNFNLSYLEVNERTADILAHLPMDLHYLIRLYNRETKGDERIRRDG